MSISATNINNNLEKISKAILAAERAGIYISHVLYEDILTCVALAHNINRTIDLNSDNASVKLNSLLKHIYAVTPAPATVGVTH